MEIQKKGNGQWAGNSTLVGLRFGFGHGGQITPLLSHPSNHVVALHPHHSLPDWRGGRRPMLPEEGEVVGYTGWVYLTAEVVQWMGKVTRSPQGTVGTVPASVLPLHFA